jgi:hypothetical protein
VKAKLKEEEAQKRKLYDSKANPASATQDHGKDDIANKDGADPERITLADIASSSRGPRRKKGEAYTGPRPNLRDTLARQARASAGVSR